MKKILTILALCTAITACSETPKTVEEAKVMFENQCVSLGYPKGGAQYMNCMQDLMQRYEQTQQRIQLLQQTGGMR